MGFNSAFKGLTQKSSGFSAGPCIQNQIWICSTVEAWWWLRGAETCSVVHKCILTTKTDVLDWIIHIPCDRYSSTLSLTSALDGCGWLRLRPAALPPRITRYRFYRKVGGPRGRSERVQNISSSPAFDTRTVQSVGSRCTDVTFPAHDVDIFLNKIHWRAAVNP